MNATPSETESQPRTNLLAFRSESSWLLGLLVQLFVLCVAIAYFGFFKDEPWGGFATTSILLGGANLAWMTRLRFTDAAFVSLACFFATYVALPVLYATGAAWTTGVGVALGNWDLLTRANLGAILGLAGYAVGRRLGPMKRPRRSEPKREILTRRRARQLAVLYAAAGVAGWLQLAVVSGFSVDVLIGQGQIRTLWGGGGGIGIFLVYAMVIACLCALGAGREVRLHSPASLAVMAMTIGTVLITRSRVVVFSVVLAAVSFRLLRRRPPRAGSLSWRAKLGLCVLAILGVFFMDAFRVYRSGGGWDEDVSISLTTGLVSAFDTVVGYFMVLEDVPAVHDYWYGKSLFYSLVTYVPKAIFPSKYEWAFGHVRFTELFYGLPADDADVTVYGYSLIGELYLNFGWVGIPLGMVLIGFVDKRLALQAHDRGCTMFFHLFYAVYLAFFIPILHKTGLGNSLANLLQSNVMLFVFPVWVLDRVESVRKSRSSTAAGTG